MSCPSMEPNKLLNYQVQRVGCKGMQPNQLPPKLLSRQVRSTGRPSVKPAKLHEHTNFNEQAEELQERKVQ